MSEEDRLPELLAEDGLDPETAVTLLPALRQLRQETAYTPETAVKAQFIAQMVAATKAESPNTQSVRPPLREWWPWLLLQGQIRVVQKEIWQASALVMALGCLVTFATSRTSPSTLPFIFIAPLITAFSLAFLYDGSLAPIFELENSTPATAHLLLLARLLLVFAFDCALGLCASVLFTQFLPGSPILWQLVLTWLAPMAFLSALAFFISIWSGDGVMGSLGSLALWVIYSGWHFSQWFTAPTAPFIAWQWSGWLLAAAFLLGGWGLWLASQTERQLNGFNHG